MFQGKVCVIVGAAKGAGRLIAEQFAARGCTIAFMDSDKKSGRWLKTALSRKFGADTFFFHGDTGSEEDLEIFASVVVDQYGRIDYFINNASLNQETLLSGYDTMAVTQAALRISVVAPYILDKIFKGHFKDGGVEVYTIPGRDFFLQEDERAYRMVKESVESLTRLCAESYQGHVRVNCICTDETREGSKTYLADTIRFVCEDSSAFLNGKSMSADSGLMKMTAYPGNDGWNIVCE